MRGDIAMAREAADRTETDEPEPAEPAYPLYTARLLGTFALADMAGNDVLPHGRKARALFAYLLLSDGVPVSRQKLMTLAWSERGEDQARASLRQALYECRALSAGNYPLLRIGRDRVSLDTTRVESDVDRILGWQRCGDAAGIVETIGRSIDPLLTDLDDIDPPFDMWLAIERARLNEIVCAAIADAGATALGRGDASIARHLANVLVDSDPLDEASAQLAMKCCHACGDLRAVHRTFDRLKASLARDLGAAPSPETLSIFRQLTSGEARPPPNVDGQAAIAAPPQKNVSVADNPIEHSFSAKSSPPIRQSHRQLRTAIAAVCVASIAAVGGALLRSRGASDNHIIAVEPLVARADDAPAQVVRMGLSNDLAAAMVGNPSHFSVSQTGQHGARSGASQFVLAGNAATIGATLHAQVQLNNVANGAILWSHDFVGEPAQADVLREQVATKIGAVINCALSTRHRGRAPVGDDATRLYLEACDRIGDFDVDGALGLFRQVTTLAPRFARAWADLATTEAFAADDLAPEQRASALAEARQDAQRALTIDPRTGLAYYAIARTMPGIQNWFRRMAVVSKGLAVEPDGSELNNQMGSDLLTVGRSTEGIAYMQRSMELDPLDPVKTAALITPLAFNGRLDDAEALIAQANLLWPSSAMIWRATFVVETRVGDVLRAKVMLADPHRPDFRDPADRERWLRLIDARLQPTIAHVNAAAAFVLADSRPEDTADPLIAADDLAALGRIDDAYRIASALPADQDDDLDEVLFRSYTNAFRADPRFMTLANRRGLIAIWRATGHWPDFCSQPRAPYDCKAAASRADDAAIASGQHRSHI